MGENPRKWVGGNKINNYYFLGAAVRSQVLGLKFFSNRESVLEVLLPRPMDQFRHRLGFIHPSWVSGFPRTRGQLSCAMANSGTLSRDENLSSDVSKGNQHGVLLVSLQTNLKHGTK